MLKRISDFTRWHVTKHLYRWLTRRDYRGASRLVHGWVLPASISPPPVCYCAGVGENIDLEDGLMELYGARVFAFDPTPRAIRFIEQRKPDPSRLTFMPVGLWSEDTTLRFVAPDNPGFVSHSVVDPDTTKDFFDAPCRRLSSLMSELGHERIDLLKMNIEGAEYQVLTAMIADRIKPPVLTLTFEGRWAFFNALRWTHRLRRYGYAFVGMHGWSATFAIQPVDAR